ncbi:MAG: hypothetical protein JXR73_10590, partial [Candidatus Omnitrophica bacterium]|nr:hypothetical protein [Candidatus Omnitrophota bacterium]
MNPENDRKSILDFSLQLGVRTEAVLQAMRDMGLSADESSEIGADEKSVILDRMIENGAISSCSSKKIKPRKLSGQSAVPDDLLIEALGASENGFSDAYIPRQVLFEQNLNTKSLFQKWFGPKNQLASSIKDKSLSPDAVESMFISADEILEPASPPPRAQQTATPLKSESTPPGSNSAQDEEMQNEAPEESPLEEPLTGQEPMELDQEEIEVGSDFLDNIEGIDEIDLEDDSNLEVSDINDLEDLDFADESFEDIRTEGENGDELEDLFDEDELDDASPENEEKPEKTKLYKIHPEEAPSNLLERLFARIRLSPAEMWTLMIGSVVIMLVLLGATLYWWMFASPRAVESVLAEADSVYNRAVELETPEWRRGRILWEKPRDSFAEAAALFADYLERSPKDPQALKLAYKNMCDCYYRIAVGDKQEGDRENSGNAFRQMAALYENYLDLIEKVAGVNIGDSHQPQLAYPELEDQRLALYRIALAKRELEQFDQTIQRLQDFIDRFPNTDQAMEAMIEIGNSYQEWAKSKKDQERTLLGDAVNAYKTALEAVPASDSFRRMQIYAKIGDANHAIYEHDRSHEKPEEANQYLIESIANYEKAIEQIEQQEDQPNSQIPLSPAALRDRREDIQKVQKKLADLYLLRGRENAIQWRNYEETAEPFPDFIIYKQQMLEEAQRQQESAKRFLEQANSLYDQLLAQSDSLSDQDYEDIVFNKTHSFFIMRDYPQALAAGEILLQSTDVRKLSDSTKTKTLYLLGDAAWEQAKENNDYALVKDYY